MPEDRLERLGPVETDVRQVNRTLDELWARTLLETRAYTGNIVALTEQKHRERVEQALSTLGGRYAGRQIVGVMDGDETVRVQVSLIPQRGLYVERVVLDANPEHLQGAILPLLRPATRNHVWWASDAPPAGELLQELSELADQVIADTLSLGIPTDRRYALADLGWARTSRWREALAQFFDQPEHAQQLARLDSLVVESAGHNPRPARLFAGWVASKLGWLDLSRVRVQTGVHCERENSDLCRVSLEGDGVSFTLEARPGWVVRAESRHDGLSLVTSLSVPPLSLGDGLGFVMARPERNDNFQDALQVARRLP